MTMFDDIHGSSISPWRILIVENDSKQREDQIETLRYWGYEVFFAEAQSDAEDSYQSLRCDALKKANDYRCHIVLVDQRLRSDANPEDFSGVELVKELASELHSLHLVILSGYKLPNSLFPASVYWCYVGKEEGPEKMKSSIDAVIEHIQSTHQGSRA